MACTAMPSKPISPLDQTLQKRLDHRRQRSTIRKLTTFPPDAVDFSSNDFLSLASSRELHQNLLVELQHVPSGPILGSGGSRLLDGNSTHAERLEQTIATFHRASTGLLCNSGYDANVGLFSCLAQPGDVIVYDELIHASVHDGMRLSQAIECIPFQHNGTTSLEMVLRLCCSKHPTIRNGQNNVFIAVESVYSMDGDRAPLADIVRVTKTQLPHGNGHLIVDEAHATGIIGPQGRGLVCELNLEHDVAVRLHTFGKALACNGAILLCSPTIRQYLINYARPLIYTTFMSYPNLAAIETVYRFLRSGRTEPLVRRLEHLISTLHVALLDLQASLPELFPHGTREHRRIAVPGECPQTPIFSVQTTEPKSLAAFCQARGLVVRAIVPPTVPRGSERIRICLHAGNTVEQIHGLVRAVREWVERKPREDNGMARTGARL